MNLANPGPRRGKFYKVDLSSMRDVERFTDEVTKDVDGRGIDYLVLTAGGPPTGHWRGTSEVSIALNIILMTGIGKRVCSAMSCEVLTFLQVDNRFYSTYRLMPILKESVVVVASPGLGAFYDESDPGFEKPENKKKMTLIRQGRRDALFLDSVYKVLTLTLSQYKSYLIVCRNSQSAIQK
jgi:hypothetical protein